jgi:vacuolar protein sorting-associated protein 18
MFISQINNEQRNVWKMYLDQNEFELAKKYCRDNPIHYDIVLTRIAEDFYEKKEFMNSAKVFSQTKISFEEVTLKFLQADQNLPLIHYLKSRLNELNVNSDEIQVTMLVVWLVELYLTEMNRSSMTSLDRQKEFDEFLRHPNVQMCLKNNRKLIYDVIASHGDNYNLTALTTLNEDYEDVISQYIQDNDFRDALDTLKVQKKAEMYYRFTPIIIEALPKETIQALIDRGTNLDPIKLLPTLLCLKTDRHRFEVMRYLEFAIHSMGNVNQAIHNYLIQIYAKFYEKDKLMSYLETQGKERSMINYDPHFALRLCKENDIKVASVFLLCLLELWQQAIELALTFDSKLAQQTASQPSDRESKRKLWLIIAEQQIKGKENVQEALELLKVCDLLRIEDLLPFFSDFQKIDHFKEAICDSLKEYNRKIQEQKKEMEESSIAAEKVRDAIQSFRNRSVTINAQDKCSSCGVFLLVRPFFLFPCSHKFHADCLEKQLMSLFSKFVDL